MLVIQFFSLLCLLSYVDLDKISTIQEWPKLDLSNGCVVFSALPVIIENLCLAMLEKRKFMMMSREIEFQIVLGIGRGFKKLGWMVEIPGTSLTSKLKYKPFSLLKTISVGDNHLIGSDESLVALSTCNGGEEVTTGLAP